MQVDYDNVVNVLSVVEIEFEVEVAVVVEGTLQGYWPSYEALYLPFPVFKLVAAEQLHIARMHYCDISAKDVLGSPGALQSCGEGLVADLATNEAGVEEALGRGRRRGRGRR